MFTFLIYAGFLLAGAVTAIAFGVAYGIAGASRKRSATTCGLRAAVAALIVLLGFLFLAWLGWNSDFEKQIQDLFR